MKTKQEIQTEIYNKYRSLGKWFCARKCMDAYEKHLSQHSANVLVSGNEANPLSSNKKDGEVALQFCKEDLRKAFDAGMKYQFDGMCETGDGSGARDFESWYKYFITP